MTIKKTLTNLVAGGLTLLGSSCSPDKDYEYYFSGKIGDDQVEFYRVDYHLLPIRNDNVLIVEKSNGTTIKYQEIFNDNLVLLDYVTINRPGESPKTYDGDDDIGRAVLNEAQKQFDGYLRQIKEIKMKKALEGLK